MKRLAALVLFLGLAALPARAQHSVTLSWTETTTCGTASSCTITYNVYRGTAPGAEDMTKPINSSPITALTYKDTNVTLGSGAVTYYYVFQAVETLGSLVLTSASSTEVSATFPALPGAPVPSVPSVS